MSDESQITKAADPTSSSKRYRLVQMVDIEPVPCPCGQAKRAFMDEPDRIASMHITEIHHDSKTHYHKTMTEMYYVLKGEGTMELDGDSFPIKPGSAIMIRPECRHRAVGKLQILIVPIPGFDPKDEWFD